MHSSCRLLAACHSGYVSLFFNPRKIKIKKGVAAKQSFGAISRTSLYFYLLNTDKKGRTIIYYSFY
jgi:hypothetical protein